jgi:predicted O-linked N-acetylglucosamine transferase (SPINDLY family)
LTFGCLAPQYKITTDVINAWSQILTASPTSRLVLKNKVLEKPAARAFVSAQFARFSISPDRLDLEGPAEHFTFLERYSGIDLALDTFPYNGGTTTMEALWQGVPVLCFTGDRWASRISASLVREAGLGEFVAPDLEHHIAQATDMATDPRTPGRLRELRTSMRHRLGSASVCNVSALARNIENAYRIMWKRWCEPSKQ